MHTNPNHRWLFLFLIMGTLAFFAWDMAVGSVSISLSELGDILTGKNQDQALRYIVLDFRLPKALTAVFAGSGLAVSGMLMQTFFRNPLAGPDVLGLSSGSGLGVAFAVMGAGLFPAFWGDGLLSSYGTVAASCLGSMAVLLAVLSVSHKVRDSLSLLVIGIMFSSFAGAVVGILSYYGTAEQLQKFTFWSLGSLGNLSWEALWIMAATVSSGLLLSLTQLKALDSLLLGENYARSLGLEIRRSRWLIIVATGLLAGGVTAFAGPIAFVGVAVPHLARLLFKLSSHRLLFLANLLLGAGLLLLCDSASTLLSPDMPLPINAVTAVIGAPVLIWLLVRKNLYP